MATATKSSKRGPRAGSVQGYFRAIFKENPKLLKQRSNDALYERWLKDHPGEKVVPEKVKQGLSNLKSVLRKRRGRRRLMKEEAANAPAGRPAVTASPKALMNLESAIDTALILARQLDPQGEGDVARMLRSARNRVIVQIEGA